MTATCPHCHTILHHMVETCYHCGKERHKWKVREDDGALEFSEVASMAMFNKFQIVVHKRRWGSWRLTSTMK